jgi:hypothetical protein
VVAVAWDVGAVVAIGVLLLSAREVLDAVCDGRAWLLRGKHHAVGNTPGVSLFAPDSRHDAEGWL